MAALLIKNRFKEKEQSPKDQTPEEKELFTPREQEVLKLIAEGSTNQEIDDKVDRNEPRADEEEKELFELLSRHNLKEENVLYPMIESSASIEEKKEIFKNMEALSEERYRY